MATRRKPAAPKDPPQGGSSDSRVVLRWKGDEGVFLSGIPNRDVTQGDFDSGLMTDELAELAVTAGLHERV